MGAHKLSIAEAEPADNAIQDYLSMEFKRGEAPLFDIFPSPLVEMYERQNFRVGQKVELFLGPLPLFAEV